MKTWLAGERSSKAGTELHEKAMWTSHSSAAAKEAKRAKRVATTVDLNMVEMLMAKFGGDGLLKVSFSEL